MKIRQPYYQHDGNIKHELDQVSYLRSLALIASDQNLVVAVLSLRRHFFAPAPFYRGLDVFKVIPARAKGPLYKWINGAPEGFLLLFKSEIFVFSANIFNRESTPMNANILIRVN